MKTSENTSEPEPLQIQPQKLGKKLEKSSFIPPEIICPVISPLPTINIFQFPITPSTTPSILSSKFSSNYFNFNEDYPNYETFQVNPDTEIKSDIFKSEQNTPKYFLPHFSPKNTFQHYFTPRNSK